MRFSRQEYWNGLPCPPPGDLPPNPGIKPGCLRSPALAGEFFTTSTNWEALDMLNILSWRSLRKTAEAGRSRWPSSCPSPLKQVIKASGERCLPCAWRRGAFLPLDTSGSEEESWQTGLAKFPSVYNPCLTCLILSYFSLTAHLFLFLKGNRWPSFGICSLHPYLLSRYSKERLFIINRRWEKGGNGK